MCLAKHQSAGRGRNGKSWHSPAGAGLLLSVGSVAPKPPDGSLALALGVAIAEGLEDFVRGPVQLKWPNDLVAQDRKLGGILVETSTQGEAGRRVVAGVGINIRVSEEQREWVAKDGGMSPAGLSELDRRETPEPDFLAAAMITAIAEVLDRHPVDGFARWADRWGRRDWLAGKRIAAVCSADSHVGEAAGVDASGALLLKESDGERRILSAEIRV